MTIADLIYPIGEVKRRYLITGEIVIAGIGSMKINAFYREIEATEENLQRIKDGHLNNLYTTKKKREEAIEENRGFLYFLYAIKFELGL